MYSTMILANSVLSVDETQGDLNFCQRMAAHVRQASDLPAVCRQFPNVFEDYRRKTRDDSMNIAFQGMPSGAQIQARRSRANGFEHRAKLLRRMTSSRGDYHYQPQATK